MSVNKESSRLQFPPPTTIQNPTPHIPCCNEWSCSRGDDVLVWLYCRIFPGYRWNERIRIEQLPISTQQWQQLRCTLFEQTWINQTLLDIYQNITVQYFLRKGCTSVWRSRRPCASGDGHGTASDVSIYIAASELVGCKARVKAGSGHVLTQSRYTSCASSLLWARTGGSARQI